ncbi:MAG: RsmB/NOP family class I SAM-dependent RNA methyltransferase [Lachnospiraceae bacterium]|nr:RsmB/NOP family class I SAM-dependent RNA methyltransferase [Lachnospiraceae bacterium]
MSVSERLPLEFIARMRRQLGEETEDFLASYEREACLGIRINTGKISAGEAMEKLPFALRPVPWTSNGFYVEAPDAPVSRHPWYYAGLYYIQEPSAMLPASLLPIVPGERVLDLCAAPGGKATELVSRLQGSGLLVANDVSASRAKALVKNLAVWGAANVCVTAETPERLCEAFGCFFDKILVDAPCSGEGMFRKDSSLIPSWMEKGPEAYAPLQKEILSWAVRMLKPGGLLLYSTCTFSEEEDEAIIADALERFPELTLVPVKKTDGAVPGRGLEACVRLYPHRVEGEGHFAALLHKHAAECLNKNEPWESERNIPGGKRKKNRNAPSGRNEGSRENTGQIPDEVRAFLNRFRRSQNTDGAADEKKKDDATGNALETFRYEQIGEQCLLVPPFALPGGLRYLRTGVRIGSLKRGRFEPSQELAMLPEASCFDTILNLEKEDERVVRYLKGETLSLKAEEADRLKEGWVLVCVDGHGLGWGKYANGNLKNKYYPGWRLQ